MELADTKIVVLGTFAFLVFWVTATFPKFFGLPIGRTAGALVGATLIVIFQVDSPEEAYASINLPILGLLFGTMVVSVYLQRADMFKYLAYILSYRCRGGKDLLCRLSFLVAFSSALFTNDTCCVLFTEFILAFCKEKGLPPEPFLLALSTSANIGSSATPIGNPQNLVIAIESKISFGRFLVGVVPAMVIGITLNLSLLLAMYWKPLSTIVIRKSELKTVNLSEIKSATETENDQSHNDIVGNGDLQKCHSMDVSNDGKSNSLSKCAATHEMSVDRHLETTIFVSEDCTIRTIDSMTSEGEFVGNPNVDILEPKQDVASLVANRSCEMCAQCFLLGWNDPAWKVWKNRFWKLSVYLVTIGMLAALLAGLDLSWCTITAAIALIVLDFEDAGPSLNKVSYSLLVFFSAMFITVDGFNRTGLPQKFWSVVEPHARINHATGIAVLASVVILLSNIASNVPTVLLLGPMVAASSASLPGGGEAKAWLILAWASTVAGNLTLVGSAANLIVCEQARMSTRTPYNLSFWRHLRFGFPSTIITVAVGLPLIRG